MKLEDILNALNTDPQKVKDALLLLGVQYDKFMEDFKESSHKIGFIKFFIYELNKLNKDLTLSTRKKILRVACGLQLSRVAIYCEDYEIKHFFTEERLSENFEHKVITRFEDYDKSSLQTIARLAVSRERTITSVQNKVFDNLTVSLDSNMHVMTYLRTILQNLMQYNLTLLSRTENGVSTELSLFDKAKYQQNDREITDILKKLDTYINPAAIRTYANILGIQFHAYGDDSNNELTPTVLLDTLNKIIAEKGTIEATLQGKNLPNIIDSFNGENSKPANELLMDEEIADNTVLNADDFRKKTGHRSLFDGSTFSDDEEVEYAEYVEEKVTPKAFELEVPEKDFLKELP
jgi:hypothetical protein